MAWYTNASLASLPLFSALRLPISESSLSSILFVPESRCFCSLFVAISSLIGLPSKGRTADDTLELLKDWVFNVRQVNPRQYIAKIPQGCLREMIQKCEDGMGKERKRHERSIVAGSVGS